MQAVSVCGAASGIGRGFFKAFLERRETQVIYALDVVLPTSSEYSTALGSSKHHQRVVPIQLDVTREEDVRGACEQIRQDLVRREIDAIDLVIHSAGVRGLDRSVEIKVNSDVARSETIHAMTADTIESTLKINSVGTFVLLKGVIPLLRTSRERASRVLVMSSRMGSIGHNVAGGAYAYRASKAAQNAVVRSFGADVPGVCWVMIHPGRVETGLVVIKEDGAIPVDESVADMMKLLPRLDGRSGQFMDRFGVTIPW